LRSPRYAEGHDQRAAALASAVLWICVAGAVIYFVGTLKMPLPLRQRTPLLAALLVPLLGLSLLRGGYLRGASWVVLGAFLAIPLWGALTSGGLRSASVTMLFIPVMLAGELLGARAALAAGTLAAGEVVFLWVIVQKGLLPTPTILHNGQAYALALITQLGAAGAFAALAARLARRTVAELRSEQHAAREVGQYVVETLEASPDALFSINDQGIIIRTNRAHELLLERPRRQIVGTHFLDAHQLPEGEAERAHARFAAILAGRHQTLFATTHRRRDGSLASVEVNPRLFVRRDGSRTVEVAMRDVTERVRAEQRQRHLEVRLQEAQRLESVGRLASGVAHDFNNVLTVILTNTAEARAQSMVPLHERQRLEIITDAAERGARLTQQLLTVARRQESSPELVALGDALAGMRPFLSGLLGQQDQLRLAIDDNPFVRVDPAQLDQVIVNLIVNARDAMPEGGLVQVRLHTQTLADGVRRPLQAGSYAVLTVTDTGVGMDPAVVDQVFEPFFTTKSAGKGTGLGLATVWAIAQQAAGHVFVSSIKGEGTCFEVYLPRSEAPPATVPARDERRAPGSALVTV
jgi:two-component system cell cycle sensor histidine kinase/response regulator CckA